MSGLRTFFLVGACCVFTGACTDDDPPPAGPDPTDSPISLENSELLSGSEALLRSTAFAAFELLPATDGDGAEIPNRWTNSSVEVDGEEVDSWREGDDAIAFRVPVAGSGTASVEVRAGPAGFESFSVKRLGLVNAFRYDECVYVLSPHNMLLGFVGLGEDAVLLTSECSDPVASVIRAGHARILPPVHGSLESLPESSEAYEGAGNATLAVRMYTPGTTFQEGRVIIERSVPLSEDGSVPEPDLWRATVGQQVEYAEPVSCVDFPEEPFTVVELAEDVCLTVDMFGRVRRNGELIFETTDGLFNGRPPIRFTTSSNGRSVLTHWGQGGWALDDAYPVFDADGNLEYTIDGFADRDVVAGLFSPSGEDLVVLAQNDQEEPPTVELYAAASGERLAEAALADGSSTPGGIVAGAAFVNERLWVVQAADGDGALHVLDPSSLSIERSIRFRAPAVGGYQEGRVRPTPGAAVLPDVTGRRAYIVTHFDARMFGFLVDVF